MGVCWASSATVPRRANIARTEDLAIVRSFMSVEESTRRATLTLHPLSHTISGTRYENRNKSFDCAVSGRPGIGRGGDLPEAPEGGAGCTEFADHADAVGEPGADVRDTTESGAISTDRGTVAADAAAGGTAHQPANERAAQRHVQQHVRAAKDRGRERDQGGAAGGSEAGVAALESGWDAF